jgi:GWxTD domain-containing protein
MNACLVTAPGVVRPLLRICGMVALSLTSVQAQTPADTAGLIAFSRYEAGAHTAVPRGNERGIVAAATPRGSERLFDGGALRIVERDGLDRRDQLRGALARNYMFLDPPPGQADFLTALKAFRDAVAAEPRNRTAWRHVFMALAENGDWVSLASEAQRAALLIPEFAPAKLALGLARVRQDDFDGGAAAFREARRMMGTGPWTRFTSLTRLLQPKAYTVRLRHVDSASYVALPPERQQDVSDRYWALADPRPRTVLNEAEVEFHARLSYAALRYLVRGDDLGGVDTQRGRVHVRYGPAERIYRFGSMYWWTYEDGTVFGMPAVGSYSVNTYRDNTVEDSLLVHAPMSWNSMSLVKRTLGLPSRTARFRAVGDSMDVVLAATLPTEALMGNSDLGGKLPLDVRVDVTSQTGQRVYEHVRAESVDSERLPVAINGSWVARLPAGQHVMRVHAEQVDLERAARSLLDVRVDSTTGFGMSDILLGTEASAVRGTLPARWRDVRVAPLSQFVLMETPLSLVWEVYDLAREPEGVRFRTSIGLRRTFKNNLPGIVARVRANLRDLVMRDASGTGTVEVSFEQSRPVGRVPGVTADYVSINLDGQPAGTYRLELRITDLVSGKTASREVPFTLVPRDAPATAPVTTPADSSGIARMP